MNAKILWGLVLFALLVSSCRKDIEIGADLLSDQTIGLNFTDTLTLTAKTVLGEPLETYFKGSAGEASQFFDSQTHIIGNLDDPYFGRSEATAFVNLSLLFGRPDLENSTLDSFVLFLPYDSLGRYGDTLSSQTIEVYQLDESFNDLIEDVDTIFTDETFAYSNLIGSTTIVPNYRDSFNIFVPQNDSVVEQRIPKSLRIHIDPSIAEAMINDTLLTENDTTFQNFIKGFAIKTDGGVNGTVGLDLSNASNAGLSLYYSKNDDMIPRVFSFTVGRIRHNHYIHDYAGSEVQNAIDDPSSTSNIYVQSMQGVNTVLDISSVAHLSTTMDSSEVLINKAELECTVMEPMQYDSDLFPSINNIFIAYKDNEGEMVLIDDIFQVLSTYTSLSTTTQNVNSFFGGNLVEEEVNGVNLKKYTFNISNHVLSYLRGEISSPEIFLVSAAKQERPNQSILIGPDHPDNELRAKLKIIITAP